MLQYVMDLSCLHTYKHLNLAIIKLVADIHRQLLLVEHLIAIQMLHVYKQTLHMYELTE